MIAPPVRVSDSGSTATFGSATIATACVPCSSTMPVNVSTAIATASSNQRAGVPSRQRIGSLPDDEDEELAADQHVDEVLDLAGPGRCA